MRKFGKDFKTNCYNTQKGLYYAIYHSYWVTLTSVFESASILFYGTHDCVFILKLHACIRLTF